MADGTLYHRSIASQVRTTVNDERINQLHGWTTPNGKRKFDVAPKPAGNITPELQVTTERDQELTAAETAAVPIIELIKELEKLRASKAVKECSGAQKEN